MRTPPTFEPVKATNRVCGWSTSASPMRPPDPVSRLITPTGVPHARKRSTSHAADVAEALAGLTTTVFPATSAADIIPVVSDSGKFHGDTIAPTPRGT